MLVAQLYRHYVLGTCTKSGALIVIFHFAGRWSHKLISQNTISCWFMLRLLVVQYHSSNSYNSFPIGLYRNCWSYYIILLRVINLAYCWCHCRSFTSIFFFLIFVYWVWVMSIFEKTFNLLLLESICDKKLFILIIISLICSKIFKYLYHYLFSD